MTAVPTPRTASPDSVAQPWLPFEELVQAHWNWRRTGDPAAEQTYRAKLAAFKSECGEIVDSYWCTSAPSAVALTKDARGVSRRGFTSIGLATGRRRTSRTSPRFCT